MSYDGKIITQSLGLIVRGTSGNQVTETQINIDSKYVYEEGSNSPYAAMFSGSEYLFVKNAQGDVTAIVNSENGETIAEYQYDPWGQVTTVYGENTNDLEKAIINAVCPLTYRGYNYDFTTGLYYLQSRYYSPEWGRFLNVDDVKILSTSAGDPLAANPYLYCSNNPVNRVDYTGYECEELIYNLMTFVFVPLFLVVIKISELRLNYLFDGENASLDVEVNEFGVLSYNYVIDMYKVDDRYTHYAETVEFSLFYGDGLAWQNYLNASIDESKIKNLLIGASDSIFTKTLKKIAKTTSLPLTQVKIISKINNFRLKQYLGNSTDFIPKSLKYYNRYKFFHTDAYSTLFYAMTYIKRKTVNYRTGEITYLTLYKGDKHINAVV